MHQCGFIGRGGLVDNLIVVVLVALGDDGVAHSEQLECTEKLSIGLDGSDPLTVKNSRMTESVR